jgi:hypothetical protein
LKLSSGADVVGPPALAVNPSPLGATGFEKNVGVAWRSDDKGSFPSLVARVSHDNGTTFLLESGVAHTKIAGARVEDFDFSIAGSSFVATWQDNVRVDGAGGLAQLSGSVRGRVAKASEVYRLPGRLPECQSRPGKRGSNHVEA